MWLCGGQPGYLLVLVCGDCGEHSLREGEGPGAFPHRDGPHWGQLLSTLLTDYMDPRLVLVHGVQNNLNRDGTKHARLMRKLHSSRIICYAQA